MYALSRKSKYGLRALCVLARRYDHGPTLISELARQERIPRKFLEWILLELKNAGILASKKGKGGGYSLGRKPSTISVGEVIRALDGSLAPVSCVSHTAYQRCPECPDEETCGIRLVMREVRDAMAAIVDDTTLEDFLRRIDAATAVHRRVLTYVI